MFIAIANAIGSNRRISDPIKKLIDAFKTRVDLGKEKNSRLLVKEQIKKELIYV